MMRDKKEEETETQMHLQRNSEELIFSYASPLNGLCGISTPTVHKSWFLN